MDERAYAEMYQVEDSHWWFRGRRAVIWALLGHAGLPGKVRILDAGCGTGRNLVEFGRLGPAAGVDPSPEATAYCHRRGLSDVRRAELAALPFDADQFDLLLACDVLEHVDDDVGALGELRRTAAPGATLLLTVPAYQWMWTDHDVQLHHVRRYSGPLLRRRVEDAGWAVRRATYFNSLLLPVVAPARLVARWSGRPGRTDLDRTSPRVNGVLVRPMQAEAAMIARGLRLPAGVSMGMLCRNPG